MAPHSMLTVAQGRLEPGIHEQVVNGHRVFYGVTDVGDVVRGLSVPIGAETDDDVICALAASLRAANAALRDEARRWLRAEAAPARVLPFVPRA